MTNWWERNIYMAQKSCMTQTWNIYIYIKKELKGFGRWIDLFELLDGIFSVATGANGKFDVSRGLVET